jgi:beta-lactamase regulating signal transducer with metallopeptidase domain
MNLQLSFVMHWLADFQIAATLLLGAAWLGVHWIRQPAQRVALGWAVSLALILLLVATAMPAWPRWQAAKHLPARIGRVIAPQSVSQPLLETAGVPPAELRGRTDAVTSPASTDSKASSAAMISPSAKRPAVAFVPWLERMFLLGAALMGSWLVLGFLEAAWLCRRARPAPDPLRKQLQVIAGDLSPMPQLLLSPHIHNAMALGLWRPTILLPAPLAELADASSLRAVLAHEAAHIRNRDLWLLGLLRGLLVVLFSHPFYWAWRQMIRDSQEAVADAVAAAGRGHEYADGLIGWMRQVTAPRTVLAMSAVGIWEKPSELTRRIMTLLDEKFTVQANATFRWRVGAAAVVGILALGLSLLTVRPVAAIEAAQPMPAASVSTNATAGSLTYTGRVIDKSSHAPIPGAIVHVRGEVSSTTGHRVAEETEHVTDADGRFQFTLAPDLASTRAAYLNFEVTHSNYARMPWKGYALSMIRKNEVLGERPFFEDLELAPAESISGTLVRPDGSPAAGVKILTYSKASKNDMAEYGSFADTRTDASGYFHINVVKGGEAVLWLLPHDYSPSTHLLHQQRGDLGQFKLEGGIRLSGRVVAADGTPAGSVWVNAELSGGPAKQDIGMPVADALSRSVLTDQEGQFVTEPLPAGDYDLLISEQFRDDLAEDRTFHPVPDVFLHQKLHLESGPTAATVEIRAVPHVLIGIQQLDSQGRPHKTHEIHASGILNGTAWWGEGRPDDNGKILIKAPLGLTEARFDIMANEHQATRHRWSDDSAWSNEDQPTVPVLDHDLPGVSVVYYTSPILLVRAVAEDGTAVPDFKCSLAYAQNRKPYVRTPNWISGVSGDVDFEKQQDGRWRSQSLLPDENLVLTVQATGFQTYSNSINLPEGTPREVVATLPKQ